MCPSKSRFFKRAIGTVILLGVAIFLVMYTKTAAPSKNFNGKSPVRSQTSDQKAEEISHTISFNEQQEKSKTVAHAAISNILNTPVGQINNVSANELVAKVKSDAQGAPEQIELLLGSPIVQERLLGLILAVEIRGYSEELAQTAIRDASPFIAAELADWLYLQSRYGEWEVFLAKVVESMDDKKAQSTFLLLNERSGTLSLPAAMASLNLGKALPMLIEAILAKNELTAKTAERLLAGEALGESGQMALLEILHKANPPGYKEILQNVIQAHTQTTPLRWQAIQNAGSQEPDEVLVEFLKNYAVQHPDDELSAQIRRAIERAAAPQIDIMAIQDQILRKMETSQPGSPPPPSLPNLIEHATRSHDIHLNPLLLEKSLEMLRALPSHDTHINRLISDIKYILWKQ